MTALALRFAPATARGRSRVAFQVGCAVIGAVLIAGLAQFTIYLPFTPVPITGQTLGVLLVGAAYGPGLGAGTVGLYLAAAVVGLPVLARNVDGGHDTGLHVLGAAFAVGRLPVGVPARRRARRVARPPRVGPVVPLVGERDVLRRARDLRVRHPVVDARARGRRADRADLRPVPVRGGRHDQAV